jgi:hypothetical protein
MYYNASTWEAQEGVLLQSLRSARLYSDTDSKKKNENKANILDWLIIYLFIYLQ